MTDVPTDTFLEAEIERALAPYKELLPPEALAEMREMLAAALTTHPVGADLLARVRPPPVVEASADLEKQPDGSYAEPAQSANKTRTGGKR